jgi:hypothetical protein
MGSLRDEAGSASLEFITAGLLLLVPIVYLVIAVAGIQGGSLAAEGAARAAARVFVQAQNETQARQRAMRAVVFALSDLGIAPDQAQVDIGCGPHPDTCLTRRGTVTVTVRVAVALPLVPDVLDVRTAASIPVTASATSRVSRLWSER